MSTNLHLDGRLAKAHLKLGRNILWLRSSFDHYQKKHRVINFSETNFKVKSLFAIGYKTNKSIERVVHNIQFGLKSLKTLFSVKNIETIYSPIPSVEVTFLIALFCQFNKLKHVVIVYDEWPDILYEYSDNSRIKKIFLRVLFYLYKPLVKYSLKRASRVLAVSNTYADWARKNGAKSAEVLYIGCDLPTLSSFKKTKDLIVVSYVGSWGSSSDISLIINAARALEGNTQFIFYIAGRTELDVDYSVGPNLKILGWLGDEEKAELLAKTDIAIMAYQAYALQSLPNKIFEYMSYGCYLINTLSGECERFVKDHKLGVTIPPGDSKELVNQLLLYAKFQSEYGPNQIARVAAEQFGESYFDKFLQSSSK